MRAARSKSVPRPVAPHSGRARRVIPAAGPRVLVVGSGWRFTSGISYYTCRLSNALAAATETRVILMRRLVPAALYPGRSRIGTVVNDLHYDDDVEVFDGLDWFWGRTILRARRFLDRNPPDVLVLQWWTGAVLHSYLALAILARRRGARVVMEWHEVQDTGEARIPGVSRYVRAAIGQLMRRVDAHVVHSAYDLGLLREAYGLDPGTVTLVAHGPYDHVGARTGPDLTGPIPDCPDGDEHEAGQEPAPFSILCFGVIRPYKGVEDLVEAFSRLPPAVVRQMRLVIVGETWEGWTAPMEAVLTSPVRENITMVNRYVTDAEVAGFFAAADAVVLPYRRSSSSGPLHIAMSAGLPLVVTAVGGLIEAAGDYEGAIFVPPREPAALADAVVKLLELRGRRFRDPHSWEASVRAYGTVFTGLGLPDLARAAER